MSKIFTDEYEVLTEEGFKSFDGIKRIESDETLVIEFEDNTRIECTKNHLLKSGDCFVEALNLNIGDKVSNKKIINIVENTDSKYVYDILNVAETNSYITNGVTSHNCAFVENWDEFSASVLPTISSGNTTKILLTSTPNGLNHFWKTYEGAKEGRNGYQYIEVPWREVPGRDEKWKEETLAAMDYDYEKFEQEFCCAFLGSSGTLIEGSKLKTLVYKTPLKEQQGLSIYELPDEEKTYVLVADVSRGKGLDYSAFQIIDVTKMPYRQVASYRDNMITPIEYSEVLNRVGKYYNECAILVEMNDGVGEQISELLHMEFEYGSVLFTESSGRSGKRISTGFGGKNIDKGIRTTKSVKANGCSMLKLLIEQDQLIIQDFDTINELSTFSRKGNSYEAESGHHDDLAMCLVLFAWLSDQRYFKEITDINTLSKLRNKSEEELMNELVPFGMIDDGMDPVQNRNITPNYFDNGQFDSNNYRDSYSNLH